MEVKQHFLDKLISHERQIALDANFTVKFHMQAVSEASSLKTPAFIWNPAVISLQVVKPPALKWDPAFIRIRRLFEEIRYMYTDYMA